MNFSKSTMIAIGFLLKVVLYGSSEPWPTPDWKQFRWFHRIEQGRIRRLGSAGRGDEYVEREITFYLINDPVTIITLRGLKSKIARAEGSAPFYMWEIIRVRYALTWENFHGHPHPPAEWVDRELGDTLSVFQSITMPEATEAKP